MAKLKLDKVTNLVGSVKSEDGTSVVSLSASVSSDKTVPTSFTQAINNSNLYYSDLESARVAIDEFVAKAREIEDAMVKEFEATPVAPDPEPEEEAPTPPELDTTE